MDYRKDLLLASGARLYSMGVDLEAARARLKELVEQGVGYDSDEMMQAYRDFRELEQQCRLTVSFLCGGSFMACMTVLTFTPA